MAQTLGVLFLHHNSNSVALNNLRSARTMNPDAAIVTMSAGKPLRGGYTLNATPRLKELHAVNVNRSSDWLVCSWFIQRREKFKKWWIIEWDVFCGVSARDYYRPVWRFPFVASTVQLPYREPGWWWFSKIKDMPDRYRPYAMGAVPFLYLLSDSALTAICQTLIAEPFTEGNGELRFATVANKCGFPPCGYSPPNDQITWMNHSSLCRPRTISHAVKFHVPLGHIR
jgi:hypothetical protein